MPSGGWRNDGVMGVKKRGGTSGYKDYKVTTSRKGLIMGDEEIRMAFKDLRGGGRTFYHWNRIPASAEETCTLLE